MRPFGLVVLTLLAPAAFATGGTVLDPVGDTEFDWNEGVLWQSGIVGEALTGCADPALDLVWVSASLRDAAVDVFELSMRVVDLDADLTCRAGRPVVWGEDRGVGVSVSAGPGLLFARYLPDEGSSELVYYAPWGDVYVGAPTSAQRDGSTVRFEVPVVGIVHDPFDPLVGALYDFRGWTVDADGRAVEGIQAGLEPSGSRDPRLRGSLWDFTVPIAIAVGAG